MPARVAVAALRLPSDAPRLPTFAQQRPVLPSASHAPAADLHAICRRDISPYQVALRLQFSFATAHSSAVG